MKDAMSDMFGKKLAEVVSDADMPKLRLNLSLELANSSPIESDVLWWAKRSWVMSSDLDKTAHELSMGQRLTYRRN